MDFVRKCIRRNDVAIDLLRNQQYQKAITEFNDTYFLAQARISKYPRQIPLGRWRYVHVATQLSNGALTFFHFAASITPRTDCEDAAGLYRELCLILVFNIALTHHLGFSCGCLPSESLVEARTFYTYSANMQVEAISPLVHDMAIWNNLGQIHALNGEIQSSRKCFEKVLGLVLYARQMFSGTTCVGNGDDLFVSNMLQYATSETAPAA